MMRILFWAVLLPVLAFAGLGFRTGVVEAFTDLRGDAKSSAWVKAYHTRSRLIRGDVQDRAQNSKLQAGIHIELDPEWKTYWRTPGGAGGVPPFFDWTGSKNLKSAKVLYPAPKRISSDDGMSIGYKGEVVFPVTIVPLDASRPVELALQLDYGVCREICIPVQVKLKLGLSRSLRTVSMATMEGRLLRRFAETVPLNIAAGNAHQPKLRSIKIDLDGKRPRLVVEADYPAGVEGADLFVEAPEGLYVALPERKRVGDQGLMRFMIDLTKGEDPKLLRGKELQLTFVSAKGRSQLRWRVPPD